MFRDLDEFEVKMDDIDRKMKRQDRIMKRLLIVASGAIFLLTVYLIIVWN